MLHSEIVSIVGGGWSVREVDLARIPGTIIALNDSCVRLPKFDIALSMDRLWAENRWEFLRSQHRITYLRKNAVQNLNYKGFPWVHVFQCNHETCEFSDAPDVLNGTNTGGCGLNLAHQMHPHELYLFGFDMQKGPNGEPYWYEPYPWRPLGATSVGKYASWVREFDYIARAFKQIGTQVVNVSSRSLIKSFARATPQLMKMARNAA